MTDPQIPRLALAPPPRSGPIDGAWWPYGRDATTEVRALATALDVVLPRRVTRVNVQAAGWDDIPRKLTAGGHEIRVGWFRSGDPYLVTVTTTRHTTVHLLAIPAETGPAAATIAMAIATSGTNTAHPAAILDISRSVEARSGLDPERFLTEAVRVWEDEGGKSAARV